MDQDLSEACASLFPKCDIGSKTFFPSKNQKSKFQEWTVERVSKIGCRGVGHENFPMAHFGNREAHASDKSQCRLQNQTNSGSNTWTKDKKSDKFPVKSSLASDR